MKRSATTLGMITGSGPEAGLDLWRKILHANRLARDGAFRGDIDAPPMVIVSDPALGLSMDLERHRDAVWRTLSDCCRRIADQSDYFAIACNTLHSFQPDIEAMGLPAQFVSLVDTAIDAVEDRAGGVALLAADPVMRLDGFSPYRRLAEAIALEVPDLSLQRLILDIKRLGPTPQLRREFRDIVSSLRSSTVLLACTELPLVAEPVEGKEVIDVTDLLAARMAGLAIAPTHA